MNSAVSIGKSDGISAVNGGKMVATKGETAGKIITAGAMEAVGSKGVGSRRKILLLRLKVAIHKFLFPSYHLARGNKVLIRLLKAD